MTRLLVVLLAIVAATCGGSAPTTQASQALPASLGIIDFQTSGSAEAQVHFLRGTAMLHSFGLEDAALEFRQAQEIDPDFAMAYWGEALSYNHPLQRFQVWDLPKDALERLGPDRAARLAKAPSEREKGFVGAADTLFFGEGEENDRRVAYADAMERLAREYPDDLEVQAFYALSLLAASSDYGYEQYRTNVKAGAIALRVFNKNPNHPGPRVRRPDSRIDRPPGGHTLCHDRARRSPCPPYVISHLHPGRDVGPGVGTERRLIRRST